MKIEADPAAPAGSIKVALENPLLIVPGFFTFILVALGLIIGSFLNVVIARVPMDQSIVHPGSRCPKCGNPIAWYDNIPVLSWLLLRGRCRKCKAPISPRYPLVELLTGLLFLACLRKFGWTYPLVPALVMVTLLIPLTFIDLDHWLLPFSITVPGIVLSVLTAIPMGLEHLRDAALGAAGGFIAFWALEWVGELLFRKEALGGGDKYLLALLGGFLGPRALLLIIFLSSFQGALVGAVLLLLRGRAGPAPAEEPEPGKSDMPAAKPPDAATPAEVKPPETAPAAGATPAQPNAPTTPSAASSPAPDAPPPAEAKTDKSGKEGGEDEEEEFWVPGPTNLPFGPWLALAGLEILLIGDWLSSLFPPNLAWMLPIGS